MCLAEGVSVVLPKWIDWSSGFKIQDKQRAVELRCYPLTRHAGVTLCPAFPQTISFILSKLTRYLSAI